MLYIAWLAREKPGFTILKNFTAFLLPEQSMFKDLWKCLFVHHPLAGRREKKLFFSGQTDGREGVYKGLSTSVGRYWIESRDQVRLYHP